MAVREQHLTVTFDHQAILVRFDVPVLDRDYRVVRFRGQVRGGMGLDIQSYLDIFIQIFLLAPDKHLLHWSLIELFSH
jgi:hypothetical protein